ncbi:hypothetical protein CGMCC3_g659 [Colletotrichum fructicola]|nr:uncharacterized protein CGMCC3_g659 [Colletotrichum fructicola]KAE9583927.1 hypothetical protein CGMCC3_g659 [Colletotrichum fructicola]
MLDQILAAVMTCFSLHLARPLAFDADAPRHPSS